MTSNGSVHSAARLVSLSAKLAIPDQHANAHLLHSNKADLSEWIQHGRDNPQLQLHAYAC